MMNASQSWTDFFAKWPAAIPRKGILVTSHGEQVQFNGFMTSPAMLLVERQTPDSVGARKVIVPYDHIQAIKIVDVVKGSAFAELGFHGNI